MIGYSDLYDLLRKEKYADGLQKLPNNFLEDFVEYLQEMKNVDDDSSTGLFADSVAKSRKQFENAIALFKELMLKRKKKLLNLVFVATETGIMKRDYENMLDFEKKSFDKIVKAFEESDKDLNNFINGVKKGEVDENSMISFLQDVDEFVDFNGNVVGGFKKGEFANLDKGVANVLVGDGKAKFV